MKRRDHSLFLWVLVLLGIALLGMPPSSLAKEEAVRLHEALGRHHFRISTPNPMPQRYFDQGKLDEAKVAQQAFADAWADADVMLTSSRF